MPVVALGIAHYFGVFLEMSATIAATVCNHR